MFEVTCLDSQNNKVEKLVQWDSNITLKIENTGLTTAPVIHFSNSRIERNAKNGIIKNDEALVVPTTISNGTITTKIPNKILQEPYPIVAYIYVYTDEYSGRTIKAILIPLTPRTKPSDYEYVENIDTISAAQLEGIIETRLGELEQAYNDALEALIENVRDGSPKGTFNTASDLTGKEAGIYLKNSDGWLYYWDGTVLSDGIVQYQSVQIADGAITYSMLADSLKAVAIEDNRIFETQSAANSYLSSVNARAGQIIKIKENDAYQVYIIQTENNALTLKAINAEITAVDVPYTFSGMNTITNVKLALDWLLSHRNDYAVNLDFDEINHELSLLDGNGTAIGDAITLLTGGVSGLTVDTIDGEDEEGNTVYYLVVYDESGTELSRCLLPATGGGGGGSSYLVRLINQMGSLRYSVAANAQHIIRLLYMETLNSEPTNVEGSVVLSYKSADDDDEDYVTIGTYNMPCASSTSDSSSIMQFDVTNYLTTGATTYFKFVVTGGESRQTKTVIFQITAVEMSIITSTPFDQVYKSNLSILYRCLGRGLTKTVYFYVDGNLYDTVNVGTSHNTQLSETIDLINDFEYGAHDLRMYFVTSDGAISNEIRQTILYDDGSNNLPMIGATVAKDTVNYGDTVVVNYQVYTPEQETTDSLAVKLYTLINGVERVYGSAIMSNVTNEVVHTWICNDYPASGTVYVTFTSGTVTKTLQLTIVEGSSNYNITPVTTNLVYSFSPAGKSNNDVDKENYDYEYTDVNNVSTTIKTTFANMNWVSDGYIATTDGTALRLASDNTMTIDLPIFSSNYTDDDNHTIRFHGSPVGIGRTIEITLNMHEVTDNTVDVVTCMSAAHAGIKITPQYAVLLSATGSNIETDTTGFIENEESICAAYVKDEKKLRISFVISAANENNRQCLYIYINGEVANSLPFDSGENFIQSLPIVIGNPACITDIYDIRIYDRELSENEIKMNYYAAQSTIAEKNAIYEANDVLNDNDDVSYEKCRTKYPCLLCVGELSPYKGAKRKVGWLLTKPDGNGGYTVEFDCRDMVDGKYLGTINVQGTSSQKFIRKNYKVQPVYLKDGVETKYKYVIKNGGIGESTLCWKADYMSSDHANTFNANLADVMLTEVSPSVVQRINNKVQNTVNGFRCLFFNQADDNSPIEFTGDGCLNNDKGNNKAYGLENTGDLPKDGEGHITSNYTKAQKVEFTNNTADLCHFKTDNLRHITDGEEDVYTAFESTYPDQGDLEDEGLVPNWDYWQVAMTFLAQRANFWDADGTTVINKTYNGQTYTTERAYRKAIFQNEYARHFDLDRSLIYYLFIEFTALVDNRAKNMFMTCFDTTVEQLVDINGNNISINDCIDSNGNVNADRIDWLNSTFAVWCPTLYDLDSCYSAENNGYLRVPYFANWDYTLNGTKQFNGYESRLWLPFEEAFATQIQAMAQTLAREELMTYDNFKAEHITNNTEKMCCSIVNKDMVFKYESPWTDGYYDYSQSTTNPPFVQTNMYKYLHRGQRINQKDSYMYNRSHMWYSKYQTTQFLQNNINFRVGASNGVSAANADLTLTANISLYLAARYGDGSQSAVTNGKINPNTPTTLHASNGVGRSDTIYLYSGSDLVDIGDISVFEPYEIQLRNAKKVKNLTIGSNSVTNTSLSALDTSSMALLQKLNVRKCTALAGTLDLSNNGLIEELYASGAGFTYARLPSGGNLTKLELPAVRTLSVLNHTHLTNFSCDSYANLNQLRIENTPNIPTKDIIENYAEQLTSGIRLVGIDWTLSDSTLLEYMLTDTFKGKYITSGGTLSEDTTLYPFISGTITINRINQTLLGRMNAAYPNITINYNILTHTVKFYSYGTVLYNQQEIDDGYPANTPAGSPTRPNTPEYIYEFVNWDTSYTRVIRDLEIYANYTRVKQKYNVAFYTVVGSSTALQTFSNVEYGSTITYTGDNPSTNSQISTGWVDRSNNIYNFNVITLGEGSCLLDENTGEPMTAIFYCNYEAIAMPTQSVASLSLMTCAEIKACANMIAQGGNATWTVTYNQSDLQYILTNTQTGVTVTLTVGDEISITNQDGYYNVWQIYDFKHDVDSNDNLTGITFGMRDCYGDATSGTESRLRQMNPSFKQCYDYTFAGTRYQNTNANYSNSEDETSATVHEVTTAEANAGYITLTINSRTFLRNIVVTDSGGTATRWWFDYRGYYCGDDVISPSSGKPSWYLSDFTQNTFKIGKLLYNTQNSVADKTTMSGTTSSSGFGGMVVNTTNGSIKEYIDTSNWYNYATFSEITGGVTIQIPVASGDTVQINHWSYSRNVGGYERTSMRDFVVNTFTALMPLGWRNIITPVKKKTGIGNRNTDTVTTIDSLWLFSGKEVGTIGASDTNYDEGRLYPIFTDNNSRIKKVNHGQGAAYSWWLRSPSVYISYGTYYFLFVITSGASGNGYANNSFAVVLGFAV